MPRPRLALRSLAAAGAIAFAHVAAERDARAWYFPEHVEIERDGVLDVAPPVRAILETAVARSKDEGLRLCPSVIASLDSVTLHTPLRTRMLRSQLSVPCIPYAALPALAGDHANSAEELRRVVSTEKGIELTTAAAHEWRRFREALDRLPNKTLERMSFVHELDVAFYFIDPGYELRAQATRAHFVDAGRPLEDVVRGAAAAGSVDNALGQFLAHHLRSLELAAGAKASEALLEHAFAMHFLQDAFAAGHLVMTGALWTKGNAFARRRHDFFDAKGLAVRRAMSLDGCDALDEGPKESGLWPCWVTMGDGHLGLTPDATDRVHAARAVAKAELQLALAFDPDRVVSAVSSMGERAQLAVGELLEPSPWWTVRSAEQKMRCATVPRALTLARAAADAARQLRERRPMAAIEVAKPAPPTLFDRDVLNLAIAPYVPIAEVDPAYEEEARAASIDATRALALGTIGVSLLRPLLVDWPATQADPDALEGEAKLDLGWAVQLMATGKASAIFPPRAPVSLLAPAIGVSAGFSYRWGTYLPGRLDRSVAELNVGVSTALHYDTDGRAGGRPTVTMLDQELRFPIAWEVLTSYVLPLDIGRGHVAGQVVFFSGVRVHEVLTTVAPRFFGVELEAAAIALSRGTGAYPLYAHSPELRFYVGLADPSAAVPGLPSAWSPTFGLAFTGGYATFL